MSDSPRPVGAVASALEALKFNPLLIGVLLLNALFVITAAWYLTSVEGGRNEYIKLILERCLPKGT